MKAHSVHPEAKAWKSTPEVTKRAAQQAEHYREITGSQFALVVLPKKPRTPAPEYVVGLDQLPGRLRKIAQTAEVAKEAGKARRLSQPERVPKSKQIFAAMPFAPEYDDVYFVAMAPAAEKVGATCARVDQQEFVGDIPQRIRESRAAVP